ncbi:hypothetical protein [Pseudomonas fluorescens]|uniref:hypothetical protein n=1 Tax=Pseudomonas fluorescens TaxID=294 RepID=UPI000641AEA9|nr:hypothetical protein [Pseudomonas fluorescens]
MNALSPGDFAGPGTHKPARLRCTWAQVGSCKGWLLRAGLVGLLALDPLLCSAETTAVKQQPGPATLPGKTPRSDSAASASVTATPGDQGVALNATCNLPLKPSAGKVVEIYWTQGPENRRVVGREADHYVDLNLIVRTVGYPPGECIEATIQSEKADDEIADRVKKIVLRGKVDDSGMAYFKTPLKDYTLNLQGSEPP